MIRADLPLSARDARPCRIVCALARADLPLGLVVPMSGNTVVALGRELRSRHVYQVALRTAWRR